jgi:hypothetical protein
MLIRILWQVLGVLDNNDDWTVREGEAFLLITVHR